MESQDELKVESDDPTRGRVLSVREETEQRAPRRATLVTKVGRALARPSVFFALVGFHILWVAFNAHAIAWYRPWDPYPYMLLATIASSLAPLLSLLIIMAQQREAHISELRDEVSLQVSLHNQLQLSAVVRMLSELASHLDVRTGVDADLLDHLSRPLDPRRLMDSLRDQLEEAQREESRES